MYRQNPFPYREYELVPGPTQCIKFNEIQFIKVMDLKRILIFQEDVRLKTRLHTLHKAVLHWHAPHSHWLDWLPGWYLGEAKVMTLLDFMPWCAQAGKRPPLYLFSWYLLNACSVSIEEGCHIHSHLLQTLLWYFIILHRFSCGIQYSQISVNAISARGNHSWN